jgi:hypothetical protein
MMHPDDERFLRRAQVSCAAGCAAVLIVIVAGFAALWKGIC